ncbi:SRPBCC family protein [Nocardia sp. NPDC050710]|uniref:SRPBCC family protein n=1 Tax=Nocardia sp. NPDC050710 TaxID=3157220 RepID=UPI0033CA7621
MFSLASAAVIVELSRDKTFAYVADLENFAAWFPGVISVVALDGVPIAEPGKRYVETVPVPLFGTRQVQIQVVEAIPSQRLVTEGRLPLLLPRMEIEFRDAGPNCCEVHWRMFSRNESALARRTVLPAVRWVMGKRAKAGLRNLRRRLNQPADLGVGDCHTNDYELH